MMKNKKNMNLIIGIAEMFIGIVICLINSLNIVDEFWLGFGISFMFIGILALVKGIKYKTNKEYKEQIDIEYNDERNVYISNVAFAKASYFFILIMAIATLVFKLINMDILMYFASGSVCLLMVLYWLCYLFFKKKY